MSINSNPMLNKQPDKRQNIKAVILAGRHDFGLYTLTSRLPTALWPVGTKTVLAQLLQHLYSQGIGRAVVCCREEKTQLQASICGPDNMKLDFLDELMPLGTAGSIRRAVTNGDASSLLIIHAGMVCPPDIDDVIKKHYNTKSDLTVVLHPKPDRDESESESAGIYLCESSVLDFIPKEGYCDIKETLIPALLKAGKKVSVIRLVRSVGSFRDWTGYLRAIAVYLDRANKVDVALPLKKSHDFGNVWISPTARIDKTARIHGPVMIGDGTQVAKGAVIFGPVMIGRNVTIDQNSLVADSVLWDNAQVGAECEIQRCLIDNGARLADGSIVEEQIIPYISRGAWSNVIRKTFQGAKTKRVCQTQISLSKPKAEISQRAFGRFENEKAGSKVLISLGVAAIFIAFLWSYWSTISGLWSIWMRSDEYSCGLLVPLMAIYIAWSRRGEITQCRIRPSMWGVPAFLAAQGLRYFGLFYMYSSAERLSLVASIAALVLLLFGWGLFRRSLTLLLFLCLMLPLPRSFEARITLPLQGLATSSAVFSLEMLGYEVATEGNVIHLGQTTVAVAEACNGLRMVTAFFVISSLVILLVKRTWWEKLILLLSALPIGLFCNTVRLTLTSIAFTVLKGEHWERLFHDFGGYAMMPLALAMIIFELWVLREMTVIPIDSKKEEIMVTRSSG